MLGHREVTEFVFADIPRTGPWVLSRLTAMVRTRLASFFRVFPHDRSLLMVIAPFSAVVPDFGCQTGKTPGICNGNNLRIAVQDANMAPRSEQYAWREGTMDSVQ